MIRQLAAMVMATACLAKGACGQQQITFRFERPAAGVVVPRYSFELREDGSGRYHAEPASVAGAAAQSVDKVLLFTPETVRCVLEAVEMLRASEVPCAAKAKNIADTGMKTVIYSNGARDETTCAFNYTENKGAIKLMALFQGMELTLEEGRTLDFKRRFDRLGLDAEMENLTKAAEEGRAQGIEVIAPTLRAIAGDTELIERVRVRASKLLERAKTQR